MNDIDEHLYSIRTWVWSGCYSPDEVAAMIDDLLADAKIQDMPVSETDEAMLRATAATDFGTKAAAEATWPATTDCDRLDRAFEALSARGVIALHNAGFTIDDGVADVSEVLHRRGRDGIIGYCFYHEQTTRSSRHARA